jgi:hypothetical protein
MLPIIQVDGKLTTVNTGNVTLWFSYTTLVAFCINAEKFVCKNYWTKTTGKHLNQIDGGDKDNRLTREEFEIRYREVV